MGSLPAVDAVGPAVAIAVLEAVERTSGRDEDRAVAGDRHVHRLLRAFEEGAGAFRLAVVVAILEHANPVRRRALDSPPGRKCVWLSTTRMRPRLSTAIPVGVTISGSAAIRSNTSRESSARGGAAFEQLAPSTCR